MITGAKAKDNRTNAPDRAEVPECQAGAAPSDKTRDHLQDFLGNTLKSIIAGVAVERSRTHEALRALTSKLIETQEEERRSLARELHDGLNQQLAMLAVELGMLVRQVSEETPAIREQLLRLRDLADRLCNDLRHMTHQLHPAALEHLGLVSAVRSHCAEVARSEGIEVGFQASAELGSIPRELAVCLYRITQEALRNVAKHSRAKQAWVEIGRYRGGIRLSIVDKGVGFDLRIPKEGEALGIVSMRERVQLLSGFLTIKSAPGEGTGVEVLIPQESRMRSKSTRGNRAKTNTAAG